MAETINEVDLMPVRDTLINKYGVSNERIGWNAKNGYVTVDGKDIFKPSVNKEGTTYAGQSEFNSIGGALNQANQVYKLQQQVLNPQQQTVNPYDQQFNDLLNTLRGRITNPQQIDRADVYSSPQYAAQQAQAQQQAQQAIRGAQESLGGSGFARSTVVSDRAQGIQNDANQFLETQVVPQIIQQMQAEQDRQTGGLMSLLDTIRGAQGTFDARENNQFNRAAEVLNFLTGRQDRAEDIQRQDTRWATEDERWNKTFDYDKQRDERNFNADQEYRKWQQDFQAGRAREQDSQFWAKMEQDAKQAAASQGLQWAQLDQRRQEMAINQAFQNKQNQFNQGMMTFKETGQMPGYMTEFGIDPVALNNTATQQDVLALYEQMSTGKLKPQDALKIIDDKVKLGAESPQDAEVMKNAIYTLYPDLRPGAEKQDSPASIGFIRPVGMETIGDIENEVGSKVKDAAKEYLPRFGEWWIRTFSDSMQGKPFGLGG